MSQDPRLANAIDDLDAFAKKEAEQLHAQEDEGAFRQRMLHILWHYGPTVAEAVLVELIKLAGVPLPAPILPPAA